MVRKAVIVFSSIMFFGIMGMESKLEVANYFAYVRSSQEDVVFPLRDSCNKVEGADTKQPQDGAKKPMLLKDLIKLVDDKTPILKIIEQFKSRSK